MRQTQLNLRVSLMLLCGRRHESYEKFREGEFVFNEELANENYFIIWESIDLIEKHVGKKTFLKSVNFWKSLVVLYRHPDFNVEQWKKNLTKLLHKVLPQVSQMQYLNLLEQIYNYRASKKIELTDYKKIDESEFLGGSQKRMTFNP